MNDRAYIFIITLIISALSSWFILSSYDLSVFPTVISCFWISAVICEIIFSFKKESRYKVEKELAIEEEKRKKIIALYGLVENLLSKDHVVFKNESSSDLLNEAECYRLIDKIYVEYNTITGEA